MPSDKDNLPAQKDERGRFLPGNSLGGRPKGSRQKLATQYTDDVYALWQEGGKEVLRKLMRDKPAVFARLVSELVPRNVNIDVEHHSIMHEVRDHALAIEIALANVRGDEAEVHRLLMKAEPNDD